MRSFAFLLAIGLFGFDSALAGPCKPRTSTTSADTPTSIDTTTQSPATTTVETSVLPSSDTITETVATTVALDTTTAITIKASETEATTVALDTTTAFTTTSSEVETTTAAEVITTAPLATPTFTIAGDGGSVNGAPLKGGDRGGNTMLFYPEGGNLRTRTLTLDPETGRLRDKDTGISVCAYYGSANLPSDPAYFGYCQNGNTGPNTAFDYLTCDIVNGKLSCTAPKGFCPTDDDGNSLGCTTDPAGGVNNQFYYQYEAGTGYYLFISSGSPSGYSPVDLVVQNV